MLQERGRRLWLTNEQDTVHAWPVSNTFYPPELFLGGPERIEKKGERVQSLMEK